MIVKLFQLLILGLSILGTGLVFYNSPFMSDLNGDPTFDDADIFYHRGLKKRKLAKIGFCLIIFSYLLQTIVLFYQ